MKQTLLHKNQTIPLTINSISSDGNGVGRYEGQVVFVPHTAVGDRLQVKLVKLAKTHAYGTIHQVVMPGSGRQQSDCSISGRCGGCAFRHLSYEAELEAKSGFVQDALQRIGGLQISLSPILPSPIVNRYRNKVQYPVTSGVGGSFSYGFYASRSHRVIPCADCLLQPEVLNLVAAKSAEVLQQLGAQPYDETTRKGLIRHVYLRQAWQSGDILLCLVCTSGQLPNASRFVSELVDAFPQIKTILLNRNPAVTNVICGPESSALYGPGYIMDIMCKVPLRLDVHSFAQVNSPAAAGLFDMIQQMAAPQSTDTILDLYCGSGVIGLSMADACHSLIGVEVVAAAVENAKKSAAEMGLQNTAFYCEDASQAASRMADDGIQPDIVVVDPPRKGAGEATLQAILRMSPGRIVMVSCNPATLARDLSFLVKGGYNVVEAQPVDMFPRTKHVECVVLLTKNIAG